MAEALFLVTRTSQGVNNDRNRVREVIINKDDGESDADIIADAIELLNKLQDPIFENIYPSGYFDTVNNLGDLTTSSILRSDQDFLAFAPRVASVTT